MLTYEFWSDTTDFYFTYLLVVMLDPYEPPNVDLGNLKFEELTFLLYFLNESSNLTSFKFWDYS
jgi:hypothetical protein